MSKKLESGGEPGPPLRDVDISSGVVTAVPHSGLILLNESIQSSLALSEREISKSSDQKWDHQEECQQLTKREKPFIDLLYISS